MCQDLTDEHRRLTAPGRQRVGTGKTSATIQVQSAPNPRLHNDKENTSEVALSVRNSEE